MGFPLPDVRPISPEGKVGSPEALADKIAGFAKVRLCVLPTGEPSIQDWLVHERDRFLIVKALRALTTG